MKFFTALPPLELDKQIKNSWLLSREAQEVQALAWLRWCSSAQTLLDTCICSCLNVACIQALLRHMLLYTFCYVTCLPFTKTDTWAEIWLESKLDYHEMKKREATSPTICKWLEGSEDTSVGTLYKQKCSPDDESCVFLELFLLSAPLRGLTFVISRKCLASPFHTLPHRFAPTFHLMVRVRATSCHHDANILC